MPGDARGVAHAGRLRRQVPPRRPDHPGRTAVEEVSPLQYRLYMGGAAMAAAILLRRSSPRGSTRSAPRTSWWSPPARSPGSPSPAPTASPSPPSPPSPGATARGRPGAGGGPELKFAGFDGLIITGQSPKPVYLWICGRHRWSSATPPTSGGSARGRSRTLLTAETDPRARVLQCGIAGERGNRMANLVNELKHFNGRAGLGAVMASKRLRAIVVRGHDRHRAPGTRRGSRPARSGSRRTTPGTRTPCTSSAPPGTSSP